MIVPPKAIYKKVAEKNALPPELLESIGNVVFQHLRACLNDPKELAYEVPELGTFSLRFKKFVQYYQNVKDKIEEQGTANLARAEMICKKIEEYQKDKKETRKKRYESNQTIESSEDNPS